MQKRYQRTRWLATINHPRGSAMYCADEDEWHLIQLLKAHLYVPRKASDRVCSQRCRSQLAWLEWETALAKEFFELLRHLENAMRTVMSVRLADYYGQQDWWNSARVRLTYATQRHIDRAEDSLRERNVALTPANVESKFMLGFWVGLLGRGLNYENQFWRPVRTAFPGYSGTRPGGLWTQVNHLRVLRNDIAHHDPIGSRRLDKDWETAMRVIGYISLALAQHAELAVPVLPQLIYHQPAGCPRPRRAMEQ